jgi:hypothetical protein
MNAVGPRAFQPAAVGARLSRAAAVAFAFMLCLLPAWAQIAAPETLVTDAQRRHAAMMVLVLVLVGMLLTVGLLWFLRLKGILKEEKPGSRLQQLQDEIARRSDEIEE